MSAIVESAVDVEEIETTKSEKLLAVVLALFLLVGGVWAYVKVDDYVNDAIAMPEPTAAERAALDRLTAAQQRLLSARGDENRALRELELRREAYRTALDADQPAALLEREYREADRAYARAQGEVRAAQAAVEAAQPAAAQANERFSDEITEREDTRAVISFALRLVLVIGSIGFGYWLLGRLRRAGSRYLPIGLAFVGYAAALALVLAADYITDYVDPLDLGPLVLSLFGVAATIVAFVALQRYLTRRIPYRRARRRECPYCGFPVSQNEHCEGCGRRVLATCEACGAPRRVGTLHCGACGTPA